MTLDELSIGDRVWHKHLHSEIMVQAIHPSDDPDREFDYVSGSEKAVDRAASSNWTVVSMKDDWASVF